MINKFLKRILALIFSLVFSNSFAQDQSFTFPIDVKQPKAFNLLGGIDGKWGVFLNSPDNYYFLVVDSTGHVIKKSVVSKSYEKTGEEKEFIGGTASNKGFYFYFREKDPYNERFYSSYFLSNNGVDIHNKKDVVARNSNEKLLKVFASNDSFYMMVLNRKDSKVNFLKFSDEKKYTTYSFEIDRNLLEVVGDGGFKVFRNNQITRFENIMNKRKLFVDEKDQFFLVVDNYSEGKRGSSTIFNFDLNSQSLKTSYLPEAIGDRVTNSWYREGKLFKFAVGKEYISFDIYDISSKELIKRYRYKEGDKITLANNNVIRKKKSTTFRGNRKDTIEREAEHV